MLLETILTAVLFFTGTALSGYTIRHILKLKQEGFLFSNPGGMHGLVGVDGSDSHSHDHEAGSFPHVCVGLYGSSRSVDRCRISFAGGRFWRTEKR